MTLPREINYRNGKLIQQPVREIENYRGEYVHYENVEISDETVLNGVDGRVLDMTVKLKVTDTFKKFTIKLAADETYDSTITYDPVREVLSLDRSRSGYMYDILHKRDIQVKPVDGEVTFVFDSKHAIGISIYRCLNYRCPWCHRSTIPHHF